MIDPLEQGISMIKCFMITYWGGVRLVNIKKIQVAHNIGQSS